MSCCSDVPLKTNLESRLYLNPWFQVFSKEVKGRFSPCRVPNRLFKRSDFHSSGVTRSDPAFFKTLVELGDMSAEGRGAYSLLDGKSYSSQGLRDPSWCCCTED